MSDDHPTDTPTLPAGYRWCEQHLAFGAHGAPEWVAHVLIERRTLLGFWRPAFRTEVKVREVHGEKVFLGELLRAHHRLFSMLMDQHAAAQIERTVKALADPRVVLVAVAPGQMPQAQTVPNGDWTRHRVMYG